MSPNAERAASSSQGGVELVGTQADRWACAVRVQLVGPRRAGVGVHVDDDGAPGSGETLVDEVGHGARVRVEVLVEQLLFVLGEVGVEAAQGRAL